MLRFVAISQGIYYLITGIWPVLHIGSFMTLTGPKTDIWLVKMVALLSITIGLTILTQRKGPFVLHIAAALSFIAIDCYYALNDVIWNVYLADAVLQVLFIMFILTGLKKKQPTS